MNGTIYWADSTPMPSGETTSIFKYRGTLYQCQGNLLGLTRSNRKDSLVFEALVYCICQQCDHVRLLRTSLSESEGLQIVSRTTCHAKNQVPLLVTGYQLRQLHLQTPIATEILIRLPQVLRSHVLTCRNPVCGESDAYIARRTVTLEGITKMLTIEAEGTLVSTRTTTVSIPSAATRDTAERVSRQQRAGRASGHSQAAGSKTLLLSLLYSFSCANSLMHCRIYV
jgi:hypothetical protein